MYTQLPHHHTSYTQLLFPEKVSGLNSNFHTLMNCKYLHVTQEMLTLTPGFMQIFGTKRVQNLELRRG